MTMPTGSQAANATTARRQRRARRRTPGQASFDDLGTPLIDVTFCIVDLETTGGSPIDDEICEIGAVKVRGGECLGTFHTLVDPGRDLPPFITVLTGLTSAMVRPAPRIHQVLPSFLEFLGDAVFVAHNERFDRSFLDASLARTERERLTNPIVDTCALARRLVRDEVPDCKLGTLAERLRLDHRPSHRALDDALATTDLLHVLLERASGFGVFALDDLLELPSAAAHPQAAKLALTDSLPRAPGVYLFRDATGRALYVGKATDLRSRVRSYFSSDTRRKVGGLLRETATIDHIRTESPLEAAVTEIRLIHELLPRYNRQGTTWRKAAYLKLTDEAFPRLSVVKRARADGATYLGPLSSSRVARQVADAVHSALPLRRCTADPGRTAAARRARRPSSGSAPAPAPAPSTPRRTHRSPTRCAGRSPTGPISCSTRCSSGWRPWPTPSATRRPPTCATEPEPSLPPTTGCAGSSDSAVPAVWWWSSTGSGRCSTPAAWCTPNHVTSRRSSRFRAPTPRSPPNPLPPTRPTS